MDHPWTLLNDRDAGSQAASLAARRAAAAGDAELVGQIARCCYELGSGGQPRSVYAIAIREGWAKAALAFLDAGFSKLPPAALAEALPWAVGSGSPECFELALSRLPKRSAKCPERAEALEDALGEAAALGEERLVERLLGLGAPANPPEVKGDSSYGPRERQPAFFRACQSGRWGCARMLAKAGANVDTLGVSGMDKFGGMRGWTSAGLALRRRDAEGFAALVEMGADASTHQLLPAQRSARGSDPTLLRMADAVAAETGDDRFLTILAEAGVPFKLSAPRSAHFASLELSMRERAALGKAAKVASRTRPKDDGRL